MEEILKGFFVIEGLDGAGTTTQLQLIGSQLEKAGRKAIMTFEPSDGPIGKLTRSILRGEEDASPQALAYLYAADREDHVTRFIRPAIASGAIVLSDRYFFSSFAYQSMSVPFEKVAALNAGFPFPEAVLFIDTPPSECVRRIASRGSKKEIFEQQSILENVQANYEKAFAMMPAEVKLMRFDGTASKEQIAREIMAEAFGIVTL